MRINALTALVAAFLVLLLAACGSNEQSAATATPVAGPAEGESRGAGPMAGMGPGSGMMERHHATLPEGYAGQTNPVAGDADAIERGAALFAQHCVPCHGELGLGDGLAAEGLDPAPPAIAHTARMLGDDHLFWRISEGGPMAPFNSAMPSWKAVIEEDARWDLVAFLRALSAGEVSPEAARGAAAMEIEERATMLTAAVESGVLTQAEADLFDRVHAALDTMPGAGEAGMQGGMGQILEEQLAQLADAGTIDREDGDAFLEIHDRLLEAGLMR